MRKSIQWRMRRFTTGIGAVSVLIYEAGWHRHQSLTGYSIWSQSLGNVSFAGLVCEWGTGLDGVS